MAACSTVLLLPSTAAMLAATAQAASHTGTARLHYNNVRNPVCEASMPAGYLPTASSRTPDLRASAPCQKDRCCATGPMGCAKHLITNNARRDGDAAAGRYACLQLNSAADKAAAIETNRNKAVMYTPHPSGPKEIVMPT